MVVIVVMGVAENEGADDIDHQADYSDDDGLAVADGARRQQAFDRAGDHQRGDAEQEDGAGKATKNLDLPGAEGETGIAAVAPGGCVGKGAQTDGERMRTHVPAVRQQRH